MNGALFHETFMVDLPSETTCYSTGPFSRRYSRKQARRQIMHPIITADDPTCIRSTTSSSDCTWRIATAQQSVTLSIRPNNQRDCLDSKMTRFHTHSKSTTIRHCSVVAYSAVESSSVYPLEAYISSLEIQQGSTMTPGDVVLPETRHPVDTEKKSKTFSLTVRAQSSFFILPHASQSSSKYNNLISELELSYTPLAIHLCPLTPLIPPTTNITGGSYYALLCIGCMEEPFLKCYNICISIPTTALTSNHAGPSLTIQEVNHHYPHHHTSALAIPSHLTPCFNPTSTSSSSSSAITTSTTQEGTISDSVLPSSYWDALLSAHVHSFLSSTGSHVESSHSPTVEQQQHDKHQSFLPLAFASPVMGMHSLITEKNPPGMEEKDILYLAFSCQDGTIRVITSTLYPHSFSSLYPQYHILNVSEMIVDGPILSINLSVSRNAGGFHCNKTTTTPHCKVLLTVGSMSGTVCQFYQTDPSLNFKGPETIASCLWNPSMDVEDAITSVECFDGIVAVGTCSGRVLVFQKQVETPEEENESSYCQTMERNLHYPIHSIWIQDVDNDGMNEMIICTRKSVHLFRESYVKKNLASDILHQIHKTFSVY